MPKGGKAGKASGAAAKTAAAEERAKEQAKRQDDAASRAAAEERMKAEAWHPSAFEKGRWACCHREDESDPGCYTYDDSDRSIISYPLKMVNGRYQ